MSFISHLFPDKIKINNQFYDKLKLGEFFLLEEYKKNLREAIKNKKSYNFAEIVYKIVRLRIPIDDNTPISKLMQLVFEINAKNKFEEDFIFMKPPPIKNENNKKERWEYDGRFISYWLFVFAKKFHWNIEEILNLDVDVAAGLMQEILVDEQLEREWNYSLTELAYPYDKNTKTSKFKPLVRPYWMRKESDILIDKKDNIRIPDIFIPKGNIINISGVEEMRVVSKEKTKD